MIKLETKNAAPSALATLAIQSFGEHANVILATEEIREPINVNGKDEWQVSRLSRLQVLTFVGADGVPCSIEGKVLEADAVEIPAAHKVVVQVQVANELKAAYQAGRVSKAYTSLQLAKVVEVWDTAKNCLWRAKDGVSQAPVKTADLSQDRVARPAA